MSSETFGVLDRINDYAFKNADYAKQFKPRKPSTDHWMDVSIGSSAAHLGITMIQKRNETGVELYINDDKEMFRQLRDKKDSIEKDAGLTFDWQELPGKKTSRTSGDDLVEKLKGNTSFIFTLIQKFNKKPTEPIYHDHDIIIMSDEAHRSQYGIFADNMVGLLPTASRIGFIGTPLLLSDNITECTFGGYISMP